MRIGPWGVARNVRCTSGCPFTRRVSVRVVTRLHWPLTSTSSPPPVAGRSVSTYRSTLSKSA
ncbi:hypothetical protein BE20_14320 [Sorangium cellulosum]|nr:hypothetical protein BE20_14320 [Sorangium cellulosum]